jgi:hypothetical protein
MDLKEIWLQGVDLDLPDSGQGVLPGFCEHCNESSDPIKGGEFVGKLSVLLAFQEGLRFIELFSCSLKGVINILITYILLFVIRSVR